MLNLNYIIMVTMQKTVNIVFTQRYSRGAIGKAAAIILI